MALIKYSLIVCSLLCAGVQAAVQTKEVATMLAKMENIEAKLGGQNIEAANIEAEMYSNQEERPLGKVISILKRIKKEVLDEGWSEAAIYKEFACFCKEKTGRLEVHVKHHADKVGTTSANIADWTAQSKNIASEREKRLANHEEFSAELASYEQRLKEETSRWQTVEADFDNNKRLITQAIQALKDSRNRVSSGAFLQQTPGIAEYVAIADSMGLVTPKQKAMATSLLQGNPSLLQGKKRKDNPLESYGYHGGSNDIIDLVETLMKQMQTLRDSQQDEHVKATTSFREMIQALRRKISENTDNIRKGKRAQAKLVVEISQDRSQLEIENEDLQETERVLKEITSACEVRADEYDKRASMRDDEIAALNAAVFYLGKATSAEAKQDRALLQAAPDAPVAKSKPLPNASHTESTVVKGKTHEKEPTKKTPEKAVAKSAKAVAKVPSFLQELLTQSNKETFLGRAELSGDDAKRKALEVILTEGQRLKSLMLTQIASMAKDDPFAKVKKLILDLRWRLEKEASQETTKKVWCDEELAKSEHERDTRWAEANRINTELRGLEAKADELTQSVKYHTKRAETIQKTVGEARKDFSELNAEELKALKEQKEARDAIREALLILKSFYTQAAKMADKEAFLQGGPRITAKPRNINEDLRRERKHIVSEKDRLEAKDDKLQAEHEAAEKKRMDSGNVPAMDRQGSLTDALALLETVESDFTRQINWVEGNLDAEQQQLVATQQALQSQFEKAEELRDLDKQELQTNRVNHKSKMDELDTTMSLLDDALQELTQLRPTCIDTGMSYKERVAKREAEMEALRKAVCILGETDKQYGCP